MENYGPRLTAATWLLTVFSAIFLALRVYCKVSRARRLWWDDHFLIASWVTVLVSTAMLTEGIKYGIGLHYYDMDPQKMPTMALISYIAGFATILGTIWSKTSFAITLLRISTGRLRWLVWFIIISVNLVLGVSATIHWAQCWPLKKLWNYNMEGTCLPLKTVQNYQIFASVYSGILDTVLAFLPWKIIWMVTINKKERIGALIAMSMGVFSGIMSFLKIPALGDISDSGSTTVDLKIYGTAEPAVTIMAISIPVLRAFLRRDAPPQPVQFIRFSDIVPEFTPLDSIDEVKESSSGHRTP